MNTENEIYSLATCPGTKYSGDTITLRATPRDGIDPYYVAFKKDGIIIDPSRLGGESNPITNAPENVEIVRTYTLNDEDVRNALTGTIDFSVFIRGSCPTGGGLQFDGVNDYVNAGSGTSLAPSYITISAWIRPLNLSGDVISRDGNSTGYLYRIILNANGTVTFVILSDGGVITTTTTQTITTESWTFISTTYDGSTGKIYINNVQDVNTFSHYGEIIQGSVGYPVKIGVVGGSYFNGTIDEVRIYNRALSPTEITNLYNGSTPRDGLVLEHIYSLGNANDLSGYGNNGTPINGPIFIPNACMDTCTIAIGCVAPVCNFVVT